MPSYEPCSDRIWIFHAAPLKAICLAVALAGCAAVPDEPTPNLGILRQECVSWYQSGGYAAAFERAAEPAGRIARQMTVIPGKTAVVFDIDETLLSNWAYLSANHFVLEMTTFKRWVREAEGVALAPTQDVFNIAKTRGADLFLITGRPESLRAATVRELRQAGYSGWKHLYLKPDADPVASNIPYKSGVRKMLEDRGYQIVLNIGDQESDLAGGHARNRIKLPNPFYYVP